MESFIFSIYALLFLFFPIMFYYSLAYVLALGNKPTKNNVSFHKKSFLAIFSFELKKRLNLNDDTPIKFSFVFCLVLGIVYYSISVSLIVLSIIFYYERIFVVPGVIIDIVFIIFVFVFIELRDRALKKVDTSYEVFDGKIVRGKKVYFNGDASIFYNASSIFGIIYNLIGIFLIINYGLSKEFIMVVVCLLLIDPIFIYIWYLFLKGCYSYYILFDNNHLLVKKMIGKAKTVDLSKVNLIEPTLVVLPTFKKKQTTKIQGYILFESSAKYVVVPRNEEMDKIVKSVCETKGIAYKDIFKKPFIKL